MKYLIAILTGICLTPQFVIEAALERGKFAIGGELLIIPLLLLIVLLCSNLKELWGCTNEK